MVARRKTRDPLPPGSECANTVDKRLRTETYGKATNKGLTRKAGVGGGSESEKTGGNADDYGRKGVEKTAIRNLMKRQSLQIDKFGSGVRVSRPGREAFRARPPASMSELKRDHARIYHGIDK